MAVSVATGRAVTMAARPTGMPSESDFALVEQPVPELRPGAAMAAQSVAAVVESPDAGFEPGNLVVGQLGWQDYAFARAGSVRLVPPILQPPSLALHAVGATGFTAYFGVLDVIRPKPGDTV